MEEKLFSARLVREIFRTGIWGYVCWKPAFWAEQWRAGGWPPCIQETSAKLPEERRAQGMEKWLWQAAEGRDSQLPLTPLKLWDHLGEELFSLSFQHKHENPYKATGREAYFQSTLKKFSPYFTEACLWKSHLISKSYYIQRCFRKLWNAIWKTLFLPTRPWKEQRKWNVLSGESMYLTMKAFLLPTCWPRTPVPA